MTVWRARGDDAGTTTVELVLVLPAFMLTVLLAVQFGMYLHAAEIVEAAAQEAVEAARGERDTAGAGTAGARAVLASSGIVRQPHVDVGRSAATVTATVSGAAPQVVPLLSLAVRATASGPTEAFRPEPERP